VPDPEPVPEPTPEPTPEPETLTEGQSRAVETMYWRLVDRGFTPKQGEQVKAIALAAVADALRPPAPAMAAPALNVAEEWVATHARAAAVLECDRRDRARDKATRQVLKTSKVSPAIKKLLELIQRAYYAALGKEV
jgi:hypothetical protein